MYATIVGCRVCAIAAAIVIMLLSTSPILGQDHDVIIADDTFKPREWYSIRNERWESLLQKAGKSKNGRILEAWLQDSNGDSELVLSLRNIGTRPYSPGWFGGLFTVLRPDVLIRNSKGELVKMTEAGRNTYGSHSVGRSGSGIVGAHLDPGHAWGGTLDIHKHFDLSTPGKYTLVGGGCLDTNEPLVAEPITLQVGISSELKSEVRRAGKPVANQPPKTAVPGEPTDEEWSEMVSKAGQSEWGCVLKAMLSPISSDAATLVVSRVRIDYPNKNEEIYSKLGDSPKDYRILVRDSNGKSVPLTEQGRKTLSEPRDGERMMYTYREPGDGLGVVLPLRKLFEMTKPGEYSILVIHKTAPTSVAKPIKVTVAH